MMLMTKFGKFKLRLIATINLSAILTILNLASAGSNYWIKYIDAEGNGVPHIAGMWRSCPVGQQTTANCMWKNGILSSAHSIWSICVRLFVGLGTLGNIAAVFCLCVAFYFKVNKRSKCAIKLMEWANGILIGAFIGMLIGFCVFISTQCNYSMWLHVAALCLLAASSNLATRTFARLYFMNTRGFGKSSSRAAGVETGCCTNDEKIALAQVVDKETNTNGGLVTTTTTTTGTTTNVCEPQMSPVEVNKVSEKHGSNEALLPAQQTTTSQPDANTEATATTTGN